MAMSDEHKAALAAGRYSRRQAPPASLSEQDRADARRILEEGGP